MMKNGSIIHCVLRLVALKCIKLNNRGRNEFINNSWWTVESDEVDCGVNMPARPVRSTWVIVEVVVVVVVVVVVIAIVVVVA